MMLQKTVLIIAKPYDAQVLRRHVKRAGMRAAVAGGGEGPLWESEPDLVLLSDRLSETSCGDVLQRIRDTQRQWLPVILLGSELTLEECPSADAVVGRPVDADVLLAKVSVCLRAAERGGARVELTDPQPPSDPAHGSFRMGEADVTVQEQPVALSPVDISAPVDEFSPHAPQDQELPASGQLSSIDVSHLLALLFRRSFSGALRLRHEEAHKIIYFEEGRPVFAQSNLARERLLAFARREGLLDQQQADACDMECRATGRRAGAILVDQGVIKLEELFPIVRRHIAEIIFSLFSWIDGEFDFDDGCTIEERIQLDAGPAALIMEGIRRRLTLDRLMELVGPPTVVMNVGPNTERLEAAGLEPREESALELMGQDLALAIVATKSGLSQLEVYQLAYGAIVLAGSTIRGRTGDHLAVTAPMASEIDRRRLEAKLELVRQGDYFSLLGLECEASGREVEQAHQYLRKAFSPESLPSPLANEYAQPLRELADVLDEARDILRDDRLREAYKKNI